MRKLKACVLSLLIAAPALVSAETPNVNPGQWEYQTTMTMSAGGQAMPARTAKNKDCVRQEDITDPDLFGGDELNNCGGVRNGAEPVTLALQPDLSGPGRFALHDERGSQTPGRQHGGHHAR